MDANQPPRQTPPAQTNARRTSIDVPGIDQRSSGFAGKWRLLIIGGALAIGAIYGVLHPSQDKPLAADGSLLRPGPNGGLIYSNRSNEVTFPVPPGWVLSKKQKLNEALLENADDSCRLLLIHTSNGSTAPEIFQADMAKTFTKDGHTVSPAMQATLGGAPAAHMQVTFQDGAIEQVYTTAAKDSLYTLFLVYRDGCKEDFSATMSGFRP